jgi:hypothetical protein
LGLVDATHRGWANLAIQLIDGLLQRSVKIGGSHRFFSGRSIRGKGQAGNDDQNDQGPKTDNQASIHIHFPTTPFYIFSKPGLYSVRSTTPFPNRRATLDILAKQ